MRKKSIKGIIDKNIYYSIAIVRDNEVLYRLRSLFPSRESATVYARDIMINPVLMQIQKVRVVGC